MSKAVAIGQVPWSREDMLGKLEEFSALYDDGPIKDIMGGMLSSHVFLSWFVSRTHRPKAIIESGVWLGQGTWFFEKACPDAQLYCIDLNLDCIRYRPNRAEYFDRDFSTIDWNHLPKDETDLFFDDHQDACERVKTAKWFGFKHLIFEDDYPPLQGDCYSLKKAFSHSGFRVAPPRSQSLRSNLRWRALAMSRRILAALGVTNYERRRVPPNKADAAYLRQNLEICCELPPILEMKRTRWGDLWNDGDYPTPEPLLNSVDKEYQRRYLDEAIHYTWMWYARLK